MIDFSSIIHRMFDDSYVITKNGKPYHVYPYAAEFAELWDEVFAYAEAHPDMVTEEQPYMPPVPTLEDLRAAKLVEIADRYDAALTATLTMPSASPGSAEIALAVQDFIAVDAEGLEYVRGLLAARRGELERAAPGRTDVGGIGSRARSLSGVAMTFDAWNAVDFFPSDTLSGIGDSLMPAVEGLVSDVQAGAGKLAELAGKVPNAVPDVSALAGMARRAARAARRAYDWQRVGFVRPSVAAGRRGQERRLCVAHPGERPCLPFRPVRPGLPDGGTRRRGAPRWCLS